MSPMIRPMEQFVKTLLAARRVSTPLVAIRTADPALTVARIVGGGEKGYQNGGEVVPCQGSSSE